MLRMHAFTPGSRANGPGRRAVVWVQGCSIGCPGCYNPATHSRRGGRLVSVQELAERIAALAGGIEGVTISGGEPLQQHEPVLDLLRRIRPETSLSIVVFTGYTWEQVCGMREAGEVLSYIDVLIAGPYDRTKRVARGLRGSANQTIHFVTNRYSESDMWRITPAEICITNVGEVTASGIDPVNLAAV